MTYRSTGFAPVVVGVASFFALVSFLEGVTLAGASSPESSRAARSTQEKEGQSRSRMKEQEGAGRRRMDEEGGLRTRRDVYLLLSTLS